MAGGDQLEHHTGLGLILGDVGDVVEDQELVLVEFGDGGFEPQLPARHDPVAHDYQTAPKNHCRGWSRRSGYTFPPSVRPRHILILIDAERADRADRDAGAGISF